MIDWQDLRTQQDSKATPEYAPGSLQDKFVAPPFSVLDTRQGYWQDRRRAWLSLGIKSEIGRGEDLLSLEPAEQARGRWKAGEGAVAVQGGQGTDLAGPMRAKMDSGAGRSMRPGKGNYRSDGGLFGTGGKPSLLEKGVGKRGNLGPQQNKSPAAPYGEDLLRGRFGDADYEVRVNDPAGGGTSIFDPVLCELAYRWFAPAGGRVLDPFAGGSVRGIVAAMLGHPYTGIDLSFAQLEANRAQAATILSPEAPAPAWVHGDSREMERLLPTGQFDMVLTCPPYYDLEVYSDDPGDLSNLGTYSEFLDGFGAVLVETARRLLSERFAVVVVSEIRDKDGYCRGLVPDTIRLAAAAGLRLYNEAVLVNSAGSLPLRVTKYMEASRKLGRAHQNVLVFLRGRPPRGWSYERDAPPEPQLGMFAETAPVPAQEPPPPPAEPEPVPEPPEPEPVAVAIETDEGYTADPSTGEVLSFPEPAAPIVRAPAPPVDARTYAERAAEMRAKVWGKTGPLGWYCTRCGDEASDELTKTLDPVIARGACLSCDREDAMFGRRP